MKLLVVPSIEQAAHKKGAEISIPLDHPNTCAILAHELGHFKLGHKGGGDSLARVRNEVDAWKFALDHCGQEHRQFALSCAAGYLGSVEGEWGWLSPEWDKANEMIDELKPSIEEIVRAKR